MIFNEMRFNYVPLFAFCLFLLGCASELTPSQESASNTKRIALTYDDAPLGAGPIYSGEERTQAFIEQLKLSQTGPVAMFVTTQGLDAPNGRERVAAYAGAGHRIANHSHSHLWASQTETDQYIADIDKAESQLEGFETRRPWYRFPYLDEGGQGETNQTGEKREALRQALSERDLINGYVTIDTYDWHLDGLWRAAVKRGDTVNLQALSQIYTDMVVDAAEHYDALSQDVLGRRPAHVLLLHENDLAASFTIDMVEALRDKGWTIIDPDEAFADPLADYLSETLFSGSRISMIAADAGLKGKPVFSHWSTDRNRIEAKVKGDKAFTPAVP